MYRCFRPQIAVEVVQTDFLRQKLLEYVGNGNIEAASHMQDAEIGQRIHVAMKKVYIGTKDYVIFKYYLQ